MPPSPTKAVTSSCPRRMPGLRGMIKATVAVSFSGRAQEAQLVQQLCAQAVTFLAC